MALAAANLARALDRDELSDWLAFAGGELVLAVLALALLRGLVAVIEDEGGAGCDPSSLAAIRFAGSSRR